MPGTHTIVDKNVAKFAPVDPSTVYVLGTDGNLWLEKAPFGTVPPTRTFVYNDVIGWKAVFETGRLLVLKSDHTLWSLEWNPVSDPSPILKPLPVQIDGDVKDFYSYDGQTVFVLGMNGNFWQAQGPFGKVPPSRIPVDEQVQAFVPDSGVIPPFWILGANGALLLENPPYGKLPPAGTIIDRNVSQFYNSFFGANGYDGPSMLVLGTDGNLWLENPPYGTSIPPTRAQVDGDVKTFRGPNPDQSIYVLSRTASANLWLEFYPYQPDAPPRALIASNVATLEALNEYQVYVLDKQGTLWFYSGPFSAWPSQGAPVGNDPGAGDGGGGVVGTPGGTTLDPFDPNDVS